MTHIQAMSTNNAPREHKEEIFKLQRRNKKKSFTGV